jgi:hypothetical protein
MFSLRHHSGVAAAVSAAELPMVAPGTNAATTISAQQPQNRAQVFALELKMRCRPLAKTKMRSKNRHPDLVHG